MLRTLFFGLKKRIFSNPVIKRSTTGFSCVVRLEIEWLEERLVLSGGVGAVGDSYTNEYQFITGLDAARNWVEQLAEYRNVNFGAFSTTPWDSLRGPGYQYNWAAGSGANYTGQVAGLSSQIASGQVNTAVIMGAIGASTDPGDPKTGDPGGDPTSFFNYLYGIYNGTLTGSALSAVLAANVASRTDTLDALQAAGRQSSSGVNLIMANYANFAIVPQFRQALPDAAGRQNIVNVDTQLNAQVDAAANARGVPVLDVFGLGQYIDQLTSSGQSLVLGGYAMDMTDYTPSSQEFAGTPVVPKDFWADEQHVGSVGQGLIANMVITADNEAYGTNIPLFSDQEILQNAGITPPPTAAPTYFDVSQWVIFPTPTLTGLSVSSAPEGSSSFTLTVNGSNFLSSSVVQWNGAALPTTFVSSSQLTVTIPAADLTEEGTATVSVVNPTPGGGASNGQTFTITDAPLSAVGVTVAPIAGAPFSGVLASFTDGNPSRSLADYSASINWGDGAITTGTISANGQGGYNVSGGHTYAAAGSYAIRVQISDDGGSQATANSSANVTNLGQNVQEVEGPLLGILFWNCQQGQGLINSFNGGPGSTALADWLASNFPNLYGANAGSHNLTGETNAQVAAFYQTLFNEGGIELDAQVMAIALDVYATTLSLGGTAGQAYGFLVDAYGLGARSFNVGCSGAAFGVADNTTLNVYQILLATNQQAKNGVLYNGDLILQIEADIVFTIINVEGDIG